MSDLETLLTRFRTDLGERLREAKLGKEYYYWSLTLPVIDAVYSAQAQYPSVQNVVLRYCKAFGLTEFRPDEMIKEKTLPAPEEQETVSDLLARMRQHGVEYFVEKVFVNHSKTSGRYKAEIVLELLEKLDNMGIQTFQDFQTILQDPDKTLNLVNAITAIHGIGEAIYRYFLMLAGDEQLVKPDTMILRYLRRCLGRPVREAEAVRLIQAAAEALKATYPDMTPRLLDYLIWSYERTLESARSKKTCSKKTLP